MFIGSPAWLAMVLLATFRDLLITSHGPVFRPETGWLMLCIVLGMAFAPKIATVVSVLARRSRRAAFGGTLRFLAERAARNRVQRHPRADYGGGP